MRTHIAGIAACALLALSLAAQGAQTIVGTWAPDPSSCTPAAGLISIGPLSLTGDELRCSFRDVSRSGPTVTWHGRCSDGQGSTPTTMVATLSAGRLLMTMNGVYSGSYRRCAIE